MAKSDKITVAARVNDVLRLILAGAEFSDIRQYASDHGWNLSDRQVRRYIEAAHRRFAKATRRDRKQLIGRHLMQRRALYARAMKASDLKTALQVLRDEAALQGLYPPTKIAPTTPDGEYPYPGPGNTGLSRRERVLRLIAAEASGDKTEKRLVEHATPFCTYQLPDTSLPALMLDFLSLIYVCEQLEWGGMFLNAVLSDVLNCDPSSSWDHIAKTSAYRFVVGREGWTHFMKRLDLDGDQLIRKNFQSGLLDGFNETICKIAPTAEETLHSLGAMGMPVEELESAEDVGNAWHNLFTRILKE